MFKHLYKLVAASLLVIFAEVSAAEAPIDGRLSLIGIDHIPTIVSDLEKARQSYRQLGFSLKEGRAHNNGLRNKHIKFKDGSGIELISVPAVPTDELTRSYSEQLRAGEGPAYLSFHARDTNKLTAALKKAQIEFENHNGLITLNDQHLSFIFFVRDNRSPSDKPEHFVHSNGAVAMSEVWLALDKPHLEQLRKLLVSLGALERNERVMAPTRTSACVFHLQNGRVIALPKSQQLIKDREIIGAKFHVLSNHTKGNTTKPDKTVAPSNAHGLWLAFSTQP